MAQRSLSYEMRNPPPSTDSVLARYLSQEFFRIFRALRGVQNIHLVELHAPPAKTQVGLTVLADGTDWNPGAGQGVYTFYNSVWNRLG